ncbi:hypothetical protein SAMN05444392_11732 [Seinonella peptonophila]|uniref:Uncharacterized protein n=1 Tax=Seinonella peptonophila TaxID=112248 RepID=A0A1M5B1A1_9BACL|nr:hypothetical protein SAMN05444392_11732 [Seinonella peptonophila]
MLANLFAAHHVGERREDDRDDDDRGVEVFSVEHELRVRDGEDTDERSTESSSGNTTDEECDFSLEGEFGVVTHDQLDPEQLNPKEGACPEYETKTQTSDHVHVDSCFPSENGSACNPVLQGLLGFYLGGC